MKIYDKNILVESIGILYIADAYNRGGWLIFKFANFVRSFEKLPKVSLPRLMTYLTTDGITKAKSQ